VSLFNASLTLVRGESQNVTYLKAQPQTVANFSLVGADHFRTRHITSARHEPTRRASWRIWCCAEPHEF